MDRLQVERDQYEKKFELKRNALKEVEMSMAKSNQEMEEKVIRLKKQIEAEKQDKDK